jgi:hypothetical protein
MIQKGLCFELARKFPGEEITAERKNFFRSDAIFDGLTRWISSYPTVSAALILYSNEDQNDVGKSPEQQKSEIESCWSPVATQSILRAVYNLYATAN